MSAPAPYPESLPGWAHAAPPMLVPTPARLEQPLAHRRVVLHDPSVPCWRYDLVAVCEVDRDNLVGVVDQHDYYRAHREDVEVELAAIPIDRLWVERLAWCWEDIPEELLPPRVDVPVGEAHLPPTTWLEHPIQPPIRRMRAGNRARDGVTVGTRAALRQPGDRRLRQGLRLISAPHLYCYGTPNLAFGLDELDRPLWQQSVTVCDEADYFGWVATGRSPDSAQVWPLGAVLLE